MNSYVNKKSIFIVIGFFVLFVSGYICYLLKDEYKDAKFRTTQDKILSFQDVDLTGLDTLNASGSPIIDFYEFKEKLSSITKPIIIVDSMRGKKQENYGYVNGIPATYFAYESDKKPEFRFLVRRLLLLGTTQKLPELIVHEQEEAQKYGFGYVRVRPESKRVTPDKAVDEFVDYFDKAPQNVWFHFHCRPGRGRTTLALVMLDIMHNATEVSLKDIVKRQHLLGGVDLFDLTIWRKNSTYGLNALDARKRFTKDFYDFIVQRKPGGIQLWSEWYRLRTNI